MAAHIELYVVETGAQVHAVDNPDLMDFLEEAQCENCDVVVGFEMNKFFPCVICVEGEDNVWLVCTECAAGVIAPGE
jgi:hypothetical protein